MKKSLLLFDQDFSCTMKYLCSYYYYRNCLVAPSITVIIMFIVIAHLNHPSRATSYTLFTKFIWIITYLPLPLSEFKFGYFLVRTRTSNNFHASPHHSDRYHFIVVDLRIDSSLDCI